MKKHFLILFSLALVLFVLIFYILFLSSCQKNVQQNDCIEHENISDTNEDVSYDIPIDISVDISPALVSPTSPETTISFAASDSSIFYYKISCSNGSINRSESEVLSISQSVTYTVPTNLAQDFIRIDFYNEQLLFVNSMSIDVTCDENSTYHFQTMQLQKTSSQNS